MTETLVRLSRSVIGDQEIAAVQSVMRRGFLGMGQEVREFENELEAFLGGAGRRVLCVNTGTSALHLAAQAVGLKAGDEALVPTLTFVATFQAIAATGATPVACDIDERTGLLDLKDAARRLTPRTKAIFPVHYASQVGDLDAVFRFAEENGLRVIEDAAHAFGCTYQGRRVGGFGDITCFSFDGIKNITSGEGGAVVTNDPKVIAAVSDARLLGVVKDSEKRYQGQRSWEFDVTEQGWRYHMSDIMAAIGRVQLRRLNDEFRPKRVELAALYRARLSSCSDIRFFETQEGVVPFMMPVRVLAGRRDALRSHLLERKIEVGIHYKPCHLLEKFGGGKCSLPVAERVYSELLSLPLHPVLSKMDVEDIGQAILKFLEIIDSS